jgi:DNA adenine methylase
MVYAGGKTKLRSEVTYALWQQADLRKLPYREVFTGGGGIIRHLLDHDIVSDVWLNDLDIGTYCWWKAIIDHPEELIAGLLETTRTVDSFNTAREALMGIKKTPTTARRIVQTAVQKLVAHQLSYSGKGVEGGKSNGLINLTTRPPHQFAPIISDLHYRLTRSFMKVRCTNLDFADIISDESPCILYCDPPYVTAGGIYTHSFSSPDHERLADALRKTKHAWVLSYDDHPHIRSLYDWASISETGLVQYAITGSRMKKELLISSPLHQNRLLKAS